MVISNEIQIEKMDNITGEFDDLSELLVDVVNHGASIGFLSPLKKEESVEYWQEVLQSNIILLIAKSGGKVIGTVQVVCCTKENGNHRAEICKLMVHSEFRKNGVGRQLMKMAEEVAKENQISLIVLDTREGDSSNQLYISLGFLESGRIPNYAKSAGGELHSTVIYYKLL
ncbi:GNAT family N-acetyltransferase [Chengkuizengella sediminis]|uniref:GNAT family N-acetyltransferase n=1 Tax=Chengkuizengella sediminis TaxID=1885917 RepID=UPI00138A33DA|nr:GNAT family N-acetyltransferase [Chengkuizengella sediminis]NDI35390.1 GNAT family N-acetyltransferase [Chengkuizengella sediminis]